MPIFFALVPPWVSSWLTPVWLIGVGIGIGMLVLLALWGLVFLVRPRIGREFPVVLSEGAGLPICIACLCMGLFGLFGALTVEKPMAMLKSAPRLPFLGNRTITAEIPPAGTGQRRHRVPVHFYGSELQKLSISTSQMVRFADAETDELAHTPSVEVDPSVPFVLRRTADFDFVFDGDYIADFYFANMTNNTADVTIELETAPQYPEAVMINISAIFALGVIGFYLLQSFLLPKISAVALATAKSELAQPLLYILTIFGVFLVILFIFIPYNTFGEDIKMLKDTGLTLIMVLAIIQGVWAASNSVADEIEGKTALTVLSKPLGRASFLIGKFAGIMWIVALMFLIIGFVFMFVVAYKPIYDGREMSSGVPEWTVGYFEVVRTIPGLVLAFFEAAVLVAIGVAISTRLALMPNFVICFSIYVLGHLTPMIVQADIDFAPVVFIGNLIATILPVLDHFNIQAAVASGVLVPLSYLAISFLYCVLYTTVALLLALILFEDRDLA